MMGTDQVILVNEKDEQIGLMEKIEAHEKALLHRAFSVFVFNKNGELMLQQRALTKYHTPDGQKALKMGLTKMSSR